MKKLSILIFGILIFGAGLRIASAGIPMIPDEIKNVLIAQDISFHPESLNLPIENKFVTQPLLNVCLTKLGLDLLGQNVFAARFFHILCGCVTLLLVYRLGREVSQSVGITAMFLMAVNPYHIHASVRLVNESLLFCVSTACILMFYLALKQAKYSYFIGLGILMGINFYTKSMSLLLLVVFGVYLLAHSKYRPVLKAKFLWIGVSIFALMLIPWGIWVMKYGTSQRVFDPEMYTLAGFRLYPTSVNFYLVEFLSVLQKMDYRLRISWEYATMGMINGIVLLTLVIAALRYARDELVRYLLVVFGVFMLILSFFNKPGLPAGEFWWASLTLIPAVCLAAIVLVRSVRNNQIAMICAGVFVMYGLISSVLFVQNLSAQVLIPPRHMATFVDDDFVVAKVFDDRNRKDLAVTEMLRLLKLAPNDVEKLSYLGWLYRQMGLEEQADAAWLRALDLEPAYIDPWNRLPNTLPQRLRYYLDGRSAALQGADKDMRIGILYFHAGDYMTADSYFLRILQERSDSWVVYYLGRSSMMQGEWTLAEEYFKLVLENSPNFYPVYYYMAQCDVHQGRYSAAEEHIKVLLSHNPDHAQAYQLLADVYSRLNMPQRSGQAMKQAKQVFHDDVKARVGPRIRGEYKELFEF